MADARVIPIRPRAVHRRRHAAYTALVVVAMVVGWFVGIFVWGAP